MPNIQSIIVCIEKIIVVKFVITGSLFLISCTATKHSYVNTENYADLPYKRLEKDFINLKNYNAFFRLNNPMTPTVTKFYRQRNYKSAWIRNNSISRNAIVFIKQLKQAELDGLSPYYYNITEIEALQQQAKSLSETGIIPDAIYARLDVLLTHAYLEYASDLLTGRINPASLEIVWEAHPRSKNLTSYLSNALEKNRIAGSLQALKPKNKQYHLLTKKISQLSKVISGDYWPLPGYFPTLKIGDSSNHITKIRDFLKATGDFSGTIYPYDSNLVFDYQLQKAVKKFQLRHGLRPDGIVGNETLSEMNIPIKERIEQLKINLERLRWLPEDPGNEYILVNLPAFSLQHIAQGEQKMKMKVVIGELENYTPILKDTLQYIVFNPTWNVPRSIASKEILPKLKQDSSYLQKHNYILLGNSYTNGDTIDPDTVNWNEITKENFPFYIVQKAGQQNALGKVKFLFPNSHFIYLHDSPAKHLFNAYERDFSHGCIRLEKPLELAYNLLEEQISQDSIRNILSNDETVNVNLHKKVLVHFIYQTAWIDDNGEINFRNDIYGFDDRAIPYLQVNRIKAIGNRKKFVDDIHY